MIIPELKPTASDIAVAVEIVSAYLTDDTAAMLSAAYEQELGSGLGVPATADSTANSQKRKADWELELEVGRVLCSTYITSTQSCKDNI